MAEIYGPFDAGPGMSFAEEAWNKLMRAIADDGVIFQYATEITTPYVGPEWLGLKVTAAGGLDFAVNVGLANVHGHMYENTTSLTRTVGTPGTTAGQSRNDIAVLRMDKTANSITATPIPGTNAVTPVDPPLQRTPTIWDVPLARINVPANAVNLGTITDLRPWAWNPFLVTVEKRLSADVSKANSTSLTDVTGLSFSLEPNAEYFLEGFLSYYCIDGVDAVFAFTGPTGMTVSWMLAGGLHWSATDTFGSATGLVREAVGSSEIITLNTETSNALGCRPSGYFKTGATGGTLQLQYAQANTSATALQIKRGSHLRVKRYA